MTTPRASRALSTPQTTVTVHPAAGDTAGDAAGVIRVVTCNLRNGGLDGCDEGRLRRQIARIAELSPVYAALQEAKGWEAQGGRIRRWVENELGMSGFLVPSAHHGCHQLMLVHRDVQVLGERHATGAPWWHGVGHLIVRFPGRARPAVLLAVHAAPASPTQRLMEAEALQLHARRAPNSAQERAEAPDVIMCGDFNAAPVVPDEADQPEAHPAQAARKQRRDAARAIEDLGLIDAGHALADPTPTNMQVPSGDRYLYRASRIYSRGLTPVSYQVITQTTGTGPPDSDHWPVTADLRPDNLPTTL